MKEDDPDQPGYVFALPRVVVGLIWKKPPRGEGSRAEAYGLGLIVYGMALVFCARQLLMFVRETPVRVVLLVILPFAVWIGFLLLYYLVSLVIAFLRSLRLYAGSNERFQHYVIMLLTTLIALHFLRDPLGWISGSGTFWLLLLGLNIFCGFFERLLDET
jgi:hypothetical protein